MAALCLCMGGRTGFRKVGIGSSLGMAEAAAETPAAADGAGGVADQTSSSVRGAAADSSAARRTADKLHLRPVARAKAELEGRK